MLLLSENQVFYIIIICSSLDRSELHNNHHLTTGDRDRRFSVISSNRKNSAASSVSGIHSIKNAHWSDLC